MKDVDGLVIQLKHENDTLLARVKELEGEVVEWKSRFQLSHSLHENLKYTLHQRDTALVAAREALGSCRGWAGTDIDYIKKCVPKIDHALSQIQACEVKQ